ncbi:hypothetical protein FJU30_11635 [Affinibrenneria salicis]|uniref:Peptidoglycan binding-like domain-containing protein n=1 Tax=Affinibrenneria salicis TaxID=2590031 RepID=A0A5J5G0S8_9GAMM|nr:peptidoglycan-binding protein [Affinibrenneria salicis]KAA8999934.1 hypothetical protein FJU30_11635 [Affinibrenneria salicis]
MNITASVGFRGRNSYSDVVTIQNLLKKQGFSSLAVDGRCGPMTVSAIRRYQATFMRNPDGLVDVRGKTWLQLNQNSSAAPVSPAASVSYNHPTSGPLIVRMGQVTFNAEGNDIPGNRNFSRWIHWPGNAESGVTLGRGYDLGNRSADRVYHDLTRAGVPDDQAVMIAQGAGLKGEGARQFVQQNRDTIGIISHEQQIRLFEWIYPDYVQRAMSNYDQWTASYADRTKWQDLKPVIKDILVDFVYQGFTRGEAPMKAGMHNDVDALIYYIEHSATMQRYEAGRQRARYLKNHR